MVFNVFKRLTPYRKQQANKSKAKPSTQANPAPDQASKPRQARQTLAAKPQKQQTQHPGKASQKRQARLSPSVRH
jgi:hypothetical protein